MVSIVEQWRQLEERKKSYEESQVNLIKAFSAHLALCHICYRVDQKYPDKVLDTLLKTGKLPCQL